MSYPCNEAEMPLITKSERVALVATKMELAAWKLSADDAGLSLSEWMRRASTTAVPPERARNPVRSDPQPEQ